MKIKNGGELLEKFAKKLILDKGRIFDASERVVEVERILEEVNDKLLDEIIEEMPEEKLNKLYEMTRGEELEQDELEEVLADSGVEYGKITEKVLKDYRETYLEER